MAILRNNFDLTMNKIIDTTFNNSLIRELQPRRNLLCLKSLTPKNIYNSVSVGDAPHTTNA